MHNILAYSFESVVAAAAIAGVVAIAVISQWRESRLEESEAVKDLQHTINVNHCILVDELAELSEIAGNAIPSPDVFAAKRLLETAAIVADKIPNSVTSSNRERLGLLLTELFDAMNRSTGARRLLGACRPFAFE